jgi:hypothetical protein
MKKINFIKISLDIVMGIVFALLFNKMVLGGLVFHEIAGTAIGGAFIVHMALNWRWLKQVTLKFFSRKLSIKTRIGYIVDALLLVSMILTIISGIAISKVVFTGINLGNVMFFKVAHLSVPYICLILIGIHIALHWGWVMNVFKKIFKITPGKKALNYLAKGLVILVLAFGSYSIYSSNFLSRVTSVTRIFSSTQMPGGDMRQAGGGDRQLKERPQNGQMPNKGQIRGDGQISQGGQPQNNGQPPTRPEGKGGEMPGGVSSNPINVISTNLGIIAVFTILAYYFEKLLMRRKRKENLIVINS